MAKWKLRRQTFGEEEFTLSEGDEVTIGRGINNNIVLSSLLISRNHCILSVQKNKVLITDLKSSNGIYIGIKKILSNTPYALKCSDVIGFGLAENSVHENIKNSEKYIFKLIKYQVNTPLIDRIMFQSDNEIDDIEENIAALEKGAMERTHSPVIDIKPTLKRKIEKDNQIHIKKEINDTKKHEMVPFAKDVIDLISDSENEIQTKSHEVNIKKIKIEPVNEQISKDINTKPDNEYLEFEAFNVKQEYCRDDDDEPIKIDSDSDSESEHWYLRLSQSSPGKPFMKLNRESNVEANKEDSSYSQLDDDISNNVYSSVPNNEEDFVDDIISIPPQPPDVQLPDNNITANNLNTDINLEDEEYLEDIISINKNLVGETSPKKDEIDGISTNSCIKLHDKSQSNELEIQNEGIKKIQLIAPIAQVPKRKSSNIESKPKSSSKKDKTKKQSFKKHITNSQKEERKKKLKQIADKEKEEHELNTSKSSTSNSSKSVVIKVTSSNRGAFLSDVAQGVVKPMKRKESPQKNKKDQQKRSEKVQYEDKSPNLSNDIENKKQSEPEREQQKNSKHKDKHDKSRQKSKNHDKRTIIDARIPLKSLKPLTESEESYSGKPFSKVEPLPPKKPKKIVRFSEAAPEIREFQIEPGNRMQKTSLVKTSLVDVQQMPVFSLEKITLMKILRWNPQWLEEQINNNDPPPILGHNNPPMALFQSFNNHDHYVQMVGDLLLMEIWECLTLAYMKIRNQNGIQMRIASLPPVPTQERSFDLFNISVDISLPTSDLKHLPRVGEIILIAFGSENVRCRRFFFVHNVRSIPSPPSNVHSFYNISLHATYTEKMKLLKPGEIMTGISLAYIKNELNLFEAMAYLAGSPLSEIILKPEPHHFKNHDINPTFNVKSQWTMTLNESQQEAVSSSVAAALGDRPCIRMIQGPPGTGKSSVICAIVMTYFYSEHGQKQQNRGKILICATSNAAVDELVIRLLNIRQNLPKQERFRMVRVGRVEAMSARARDVSSQQLASRDARLHAETGPLQAGLAEEILRLEAKVNMWKTAAQDAKDPVRIAYCEGRMNDLVKRITLLRAGGGGHELRPEQLAHAERRIIEGADIVVTTLASAHLHKMRGLKRRIALCIVDEAGQAIEPEALIPLTLDVTRLTLIGDPQQLPGFICSQRAKQHGLGESLFSRLSSCVSTSGGDGSAALLLRDQYRMHAHIADYPNRAFYGGRVRSSPPPRPPLALPPYTVLAVASGDKGQGASGANEMEAWAVSRLVVAITSLLRGLNLSLAVITPYNAHKELIKKNLRILQNPSEPHVEVNTVDSFQGQERDVVVVSLARSHGLGFLADAGRMNVMLTRARHSLLICLNPHAVLKNYQWRTLVEDAQRRKHYRTLPNDMCQAVGHIANEQVLKYVTEQKSTTHSKR
ncbi:putative helicase senataxin [Aphomia sociella]